MKYNRLEAMSAYIREKKIITNEELLEQFNISIQTLRRDLAILEQRGLINKVYGGVAYAEKPVPKNSISPLSERKITMPNEKQKIGRLAAAQVRDGDVIFVDSGTTACNMIPYLSDTKNVTVISHCLDVINLLSEVPNVTGICLGGTLVSESRTFLSDTTFYPYNYNKAFISTVGISATRGFTNTNLQEGSMKSHVIKHAKEVYIVADSSKFDVIAFNHFADYQEVDHLITDRKPEEKYLRLLDNHRIDIICE